MITTNALRAVSAYNSTTTLVDEDRIIAEVQDDLATLQSDLSELLVKPSWNDMTAANKLLSAALGQKTGIVLFLSAALAEATEGKMLLQIQTFTSQINNIISHTVSIKQAHEISSSIAMYYERDCIKDAIENAKREQYENDYSAATGEL